MGWVCVCLNHSYNAAGTHGLGMCLPLRQQLVKADCQKGPGLGGWASWWGDSQDVLIQATEGRSPAARSVLGGLLSFIPTAMSFPFLASGFRWQGKSCSVVDIASWFPKPPTNLFSLVFLNKKLKVYNIHRPRLPCNWGQL